MRKHYTTRCKEKIADLEGKISFLGAKIQQLEPMADEMLKKYKDEERQRKKHEEARYNAESEIVKLQQINTDLSRRLLSQTKLEEELKKANSEIKSLQKKLNIRLGSEAPYGLSTPSSKVPNKKNSTSENQAKRGGAKKGHKGYGRKAILPEVADSKTRLETPSKPCSCGCKNWELLNPDPVSHSVLRFIPSKIEKEIYYKYINKCTDCGKTATANTPGVFPRALYCNSMVAHLLTEFFFWGHTAGSIERKTGVNIGTFFNIAHRIGASLKPIFDNILEEIRHSRHLHADETPWMKDGAKGYAWLFANDDFRVFICRHTRSSEVPLAVLGKEKSSLVLITDRYVGYSPLKTEQQFCYVHLIRDVKKLKAEFPDDKEINCFTKDLKKLLKKEIALQSKKLSLTSYQNKAENLKSKIMEICNKEANHPGIQHIQNIFREHEDKLFHWVKSPDIPSHNNYAERELRPLVIARKICFGSHSEQGLETREILMTVLKTAKCRGYDPTFFLEKVLNVLAENKNADVSKMLSLNIDDKEYLVA
jgi:transposase